MSLSKRLDEARRAFTRGDMAAAAADHWMSTSPYMMVILPADVDLSELSTNEHSDDPFVTCAGTPYQHIMVPVGDAEGDQ
ncbi:MAG: hypothetical protein LCI00_08035 [Chloroflexi bacterium]|nr:hypothetical protein [Chloroflexota bacterium]